jgi:hypothetical protein
MNDAGKALILLVNVLLRPMLWFIAGGLLPMCRMRKRSVARFALLPHRCATEDASHRGRPPSKILATALRMEPIKLDTDPRDLESSPVARNIRSSELRDISSAARCTFDRCSWSSIPEARS